MAIRIVLIDDHPMVLKGLEQLLQLNADFEVVATCGTAAEGLQTVEALRPDVLLLDLKLAAEEGAARTVTDRHLESAMAELAEGGRLAERIIGFRPEVETPGAADPRRAPKAPTGFPPAGRSTTTG